MAPPSMCSPKITPPQRVVSLLASATEIVCLVLHHASNEERGAVQLVGRSHSCDYPPGIDSLPVLTSSRINWTDSQDVDRQVRDALASGAGLYSVDAGTLAALRPDVIVTQSLCSVCGADFCLVDNVAAGLPSRPRIVDLNPHSLEDVLADIERVGEAIGLAAAGKAAANALQRRAAAARLAAGNALAAAGGRRPIVASIEWTVPIFPGGHWTPQLFAMAGAEYPINPPLSEGGAAAPSVDVPTEHLVEAKPEWIIIHPCGLKLSDARKEAEAGMLGKPWWPSLPAVQRGQVFVVDGNHYFNRPGPRLVDALEFAVGLLWDLPELIPAGFPCERL